MSARASPPSFTLSYQPATLPSSVVALRNADRLSEGGNTLAVPSLYSAYLERGRVEGEMGVGAAGF